MLKIKEINPFKTPYLYRFYSDKIRGDNLVLVLNYGNSFQIFAKIEGQKEFIQLTNTDQGNLIANISTDGRFALIYEDNLGDELGHWYRVDIKEKAKICLTSEQNAYTAFCIATAQKNPQRVVSWILRDGKNGVLMIDNLTSNKPESKVIYATKNSLSFPCLSADGRGISFIETDGDKQILYIYDCESKEFKRIDLDSEYPVNPLFFKNQQEILLTKSDGFHKRIFQYDFQLQIFKQIEIEIRGDLDIVDFNVNNSLMLFSATNEAKVKLYLHDFANNQNKEIGIIKGNYDFYLNGGYLLDDKVLLRWQAGDQPPQIQTIKIENRESGVYQDFANNSLEFQGFKSLQIDTSNGLVQAWLMLPKNAEGCVPMIIDLHGGPNSCVFDEFIPEAQYYANKGVGICYLNYHGSSSFGTAFENAIIGKPGWIEAEDAIAVKEFLVKNGIANEQKCYLQGWSWGGFVSLFCSGRFPNSFAAFVSIIGIGDSVSCYEDQHTYLQQMDARLFGGTPAQVKDVYENSSPINYVENIASPILIIHGRNDAHCPAKQMQNFIDKLKSLNKSHQVLWYDYGHLEMYTSNIIREKTSEVIMGFYLGL